MQDCGLEIDLVPAEVADLGRPEAVAEGNQDHGRVPEPMAIGPGRLDQDFDLVRRQVFPGLKHGVRTPGRRDCFGWRSQLEIRFCHGKQPSLNAEPARTK